MLKNNTGGKIKSGREVLDGLKEGFSVVMIKLNGGLFSPYGDPCHAVNQVDDLRKLLAGARNIHHDKAVLFTKEDGVLKSTASINSCSVNNNKISRQVPGYLRV
jgi:hypothetical protein